MVHVKLHYGVIQKFEHYKLQHIGERCNSIADKLVICFGGMMRADGKSDKEIKNAY